MANVDTEGKRRSALGMWAGPRILPVADGVIAIYDRQRVLVYSMEPEGPPVPEPIPWDPVKTVSAGIPKRRSARII